MPPQGTKYQGGHYTEDQMRRAWGYGKEGRDELVVPIEELRQHWAFGSHRDGEQMVTDERSGGSKAQKAARVSLVPADSLRALATHYGQAGGPPGGPKKYDDWNWAKGLPWSSLLDAMMRHFMNFMDPDEPDYDPETGTHEMIVVAWHAMNLAHYAMNVERYEEFDDRWGDLDGD